MTFKEAYDKIIEAYFKDEIKPYDIEFCFCGTLAYNGNTVWNFWTNDVYSKNELEEMEYVLLKKISDLTIGGNDIFQGSPKNRHKVLGHPEYENAVFCGMRAALDVLRKIHESRGEVIEPFEFKKRELATV